MICLTHVEEKDEAGHINFYNYTHTASEYRQ